jgi:cytochrome c oxidase subunit 2
VKNKAFAVLAALGCLLFASTAFADQPFDWQKGLQPAATSIMEEIRWFEQYTLWFIVPVTLFVLVLLIVVVVKFRESVEPGPVQDEPQHGDRSRLDARPGHRSPVPGRFPPSSF